MKPIKVTAELEKLSMENLTNYSLSPSNSFKQTDRRYGVVDVRKFVRLTSSSVKEAEHNELGRAIARRFLYTLFEQC